MAHGPAEGGEVGGSASGVNDQSAIKVNQRQQQEVKKEKINKELK